MRARPTRLVSREITPTATVATYERGATVIKATTSAANPNIITLKIRARHPIAFGEVQTR